MQKALYVGAADRLGKWPTAPRPIKLTTLLGLLDILAAPDSVSVEVQPSPMRQEVTILPIHVKPAVPATQQVVVRPIIPMVPKSSVREGSGSGSSNFAASNVMGLVSAPEPRGAPEQFDDILLVNHSDVALKFMQNRLAG